ncbi:Bardet-Biedl syndrome 2 protein homolog [Cephus cinctus]|uniref:Bardet-Biedl syndrome 2 protein homolog n=1 Tax=Cephus cinctus TaxID=211228 RepID=A0AAJ7RSB2_CEPCN|nr:Bardet-Biedl syndrome 2 protein homolog [Cephus cinctus]
MAAFSLYLQRRIQPTIVASGKFDGSHACLAVATSSGNILVHSPHRIPSTTNPSNPQGEQSNARLAWSGELAELQIGKQVTAICTGRFGEDEREILFVGTLTHLLVYNVEDNADVFYKEMQDGVHCMAVGKLGWLPNQVAIIGGNCSVTVLDFQGNEIFWTVTGDVVTSLTLFDFDGDGNNELLTGTEDFELKVQKEDAVLWETKETASVTALTSLPNRQFAYAVGNGTVGVYESGQRLWRVKSKHRVVSIRAFDVNGDGILELVTGWSSGKIDARSCATGEVIFRCQLSAGIAGIVEADYRRTGRSDLVVVSVIGEVRGYAAGSIVDSSEPGETMRELLAKKHALQLELRQRAAAVPSTYHGTRLAISLTSSKGAARLSLASGPGLLVHCAVVFAEGVFEGETLVSHPNRPKGELEIELRPPKNEPVDIHVKACVGPPGADLLQVFELTRQLPRFCMYQAISQPDEIPEELLELGVFTEVPERPQRIALWLNQNFLLNEELEVPEDGVNAGSIDFWFRGLRDEKLHRFNATVSGRVTINTEDPAFAGDLIQSLASYLGLRELNSEAKFPLEEQRLSEVLERVRGLRETEAKLQGETANASTLLKNLLIRFEDARILENVEDMRKRLNQLKAVNADLIREHEIRRNSHREFTKALKELNMGVQRASRFRVGKAAANAVAKCRTAIQDENSKALGLSLRYG